MNGGPSGGYLKGKGSSDIVNEKNKEGLITIKNN